MQNAPPSSGFGHLLLIGRRNLACAWPTAYPNKSGRWPNLSERIDPKKCLNNLCCAINKHYYDSAHEGVCFYSICAALLTGCGDSSEGTQDKSSDNDTSQVPGTYTFSPKEGDSKPAITFVLKDDKSFTAEERSDKFRGTWKVEGSDVILEGLMRKKVATIKAAKTSASGSTQKHTN